MAAADNTAANRDRVEPGWPDHGPDQHAVTELSAARQGSLSPFGEETTFPLTRISYQHPTTVINK